MDKMDKIFDVYTIAQSCFFEHVLPAWDIGPMLLFKKYCVNGTFFTWYFVI